MAMRRDLLAEAVETAESLLKDGHPLAPFLITDHWGDRRVEQFEGEGLQGAKTRFRDFMRTAAGDESCALVYTGAVADADEAIVIECGQTGQREAEVFVQHYRARRGRLRGFKLVGEARPVGVTESVA